MLEDRRIVDEQIERPECFRRLRDQRAGFADIGQVGLQGGCPISLPPQFRHQLFGFTNGAVRVDRDGKAICSKVFGDCPSYSLS